MFVLIEITCSDRTAAVHTTLFHLPACLVIAIMLDVALSHLLWIIHVLLLTVFT